MTPPPPPSTPSAAGSSPERGAGAPAAGWAAGVSAVLWYLAAALTVLAHGFTVTLNTDIWFHLAAGELIARNGEVPKVDSWSYTAAGQPWINHEWLADLIFHAWRRAFGIDALIAVQWLLLLATFLLLFKFLRRLSGSWWASFLILDLTLAVAAPFFDLRPHLWSLLCLVLLAGLALIERPAVAMPAAAAASPSGWRTLWGAGRLGWLPLLFLLWGNLHAGVVFGLAALALLIAVRWLAARGAGTGTAPPRPLAAVGLLSLAAAAINPYGVAALLYPLRLVAAGSASRDLIAEWRPPFVAGGLNSPAYPWLIAIAAAAAVVVLAHGAAAGRRQLTWGAMALAVLTLAMSLESRRFITLFAVAASFVLALAAGALLRRGTPSGGIPSGRAGRGGPRGGAPSRAERRQRAGSAARGTSAGGPPSASGRPAPAWRLPLAIGLPLFAMAIGVADLWPHARLPRPFWRTTMGYLQPVDTLDFVAANHLGGKVFAYFLYSGYVDYRTQGRLRVYLDPRSETVFPEAVQRAFNDVQLMNGDWQRTIEDSGADWVLWTRSGWDGGKIERQLEASGRWRRVHRDARSVLLARAGAVLPSPLVEPPASAFREWAAAQDAFADHDLEGADRHLKSALALRPDLPPVCDDLIAVQSRLGGRGEAIPAATADLCTALLEESATGQVPSR